LTIHDHSPDAAGHHHRQSRPVRGVRNAWNRANASENLVVKRDSTVRAVVFRLWKLGLECENVLDSETWICILQPEQRAHQKPRRNQQHHRRHHLGHNEH
jgi:hypothetical protein